MYASALVLALAGMASAQFTNSTSTPTATACTGGRTQTAGAGPRVTPDSVSAFLAAGAFQTTAVDAATPVGYTQAFENLQAAVSDSSYLGYYTMQSYSPAACAARCASVSGCSAFNTYFERDPSVIPGTGSGCDNPASTTNIKCALFGSNITASTATNQGQYRAEFHVVIAGSNGYNLIPHALACPLGSTPGVCGTYVLNNNYEICACALDTSGNAVEVQAIFCGDGFQTCSSNNDCPADYVCQVSSCCSATPVCAPSVICANELSASRMFRRGGATGPGNSLFKDGVPGF